MALNEFRCFGDFEIFDVVEVLYRQIIASTLVLSFVFSKYSMEHTSHEF